MPGVVMGAGTTTFCVRAPLAEQVDLCLFSGTAETRHAMHRDGDNCDGDNWMYTVPRDITGAAYGYRASGPYDPDNGVWFDLSKLLVDPAASQLDRRFTQHPSLMQFGVDTAAVVPRALVTGTLPEVPACPPYFRRGGLVYELNVRGFTKLHTAVPEQLRGTVAALAHPAVIAHFQKLQVSAVELMPITAWIDERHLVPLGLVNAWGYNPVVPMALDPLLCPGGVAELRETVAALHTAGIGVILDIVLNHTGESDLAGGTFGLRGLDPQVYARTDDGALANVAGTGNTLDFGYAPMRQLALQTLRHFVRHCGVDGYRFDLAPVLARGPHFSADAPFFGEIATDPWLADRVMIAEPWDIGEGGYQLGNFPDSWLEWNDRYRDDVRRFWRGDAPVGALATRIAGSSDIFARPSRSVNFLAAHDGLTLADTVAYETRHNLANGEGNRDGHGENFSWNNGVEGATAQDSILSLRQADVRAMLATLFVSTGTIMLTAGDEFGRSQEGNNNAYCQDNAISWVDWLSRDLALEDFVAGLSALRAAHFGPFVTFPEEGTWLAPDGTEMKVAQWDDTATDGFTYRAATDSGQFCLQVTRSARQVSVSWQVEC